MQFTGKHQVMSQAVAPVQNEESVWSKAKKAVTSFAHNLYSWEWTKALVYWLILSAGTASDLVFLLASLWMSVNANVHGLVLHYMSEDTATYLTYLATTAYVALPIFIVGLAVVQTVSHLKMWNTGGFWSKLWAIIFGIPALTFLVMDFVTISCSVVNVTFTMPTFFVVLRADSAFIFAFGSLIFFFLGKPQEKERLAEKENIIDNLRAEMAAITAAFGQEKDSLLAQFSQEKRSLLAGFSQEKDSLLAKIDVQNDEIESLKTLLVETQKGFTELHRAVNKSEDAALEAFGEECIHWLKTGDKSATAEEIARYTGFSKRKINNAIEAGKLQTTTRNKGLYLKTSVVSWLKTVSPERETEADIPALRLINS